MADNPIGEERKMTGNICTMRMPTDFVEMDCCEMEYDGGDDSDRLKN